MIVQIDTDKGERVHRDDHEIMIPAKDDLLVKNGNIYKVIGRTWIYETLTRKNICHILCEFQCISPD